MSQQGNELVQTELFRDIEDEIYLCPNCNVMHYPKTQRLVKTDREECHNSVELNTEHQRTESETQTSDNWNPERRTLNIRGPEWHRVFDEDAEDSETMFVSGEDIACIADEWYGAGEFVVPFIANQWPYGQDDQLFSHSRPFKYTPWFNQTMMEVEPDVSWLIEVVFDEPTTPEISPDDVNDTQSLQHFMQVFSIAYSDERNETYRARARTHCFMLAPLESLFATATRGMVETGRVQDFRGVRVISSFLDYPVKFVDINAEKMVELPKSISSAQTSSEQFKFVQIDARRKEIVLVRITHNVQQLEDPVGDFIEGCREAAEEGAVMFETYMSEAILPPMREGRICPTIIAELRAIIPDYALGMAWYRIPRITTFPMICARDEIEEEQTTDIVSTIEPGTFLAGEVYAVQVSDEMNFNDDWLAHCFRESGIDVSDNEVMFLRAASDLAGDPRTKCKGISTSYQGRLSAVAELALRHRDLATGLAEKIGEKIIPVRFVLPLICVRMFQAMEWTDQCLGSRFDPWWTLLAKHCVRLNNPFIGHLIGESSSVAEARVTWFSAKAIEISRRLGNEQEMKEAVGCSIDEYQDFVEAHGQLYGTASARHAASNDENSDEAFSGSASRQ